MEHKADKPSSSIWGLGAGFTLLTFWTGSIGYGLYNKEPLERERIGYQTQSVEIDDKMSGKFYIDVKSAVKGLEKTVKKFEQ